MTIRCAVDVARLQMNGFGDAQASGVAGRQDGPVLEVAYAAEKLQDLLRAENDRQLRLFRRGMIVLESPVLLERDLIEKTQRRYGDENRSWAPISFRWSDRPGRRGCPPGPAVPAIC